MFKEKLMSAVKEAAEAYNGGMSANDAVAKVASANDFTSEQTDRLVEMVNTALVLGKEKDAEDPTGSCELADKKAVAKMLLDGEPNEKSASVVSDPDYSFYSSNPSKANKTICAKRSGIDRMMKAAGIMADCVSNSVPGEIDVSQESLYNKICRDINIVKEASEAASDVIAALEKEASDGISKVAGFLESDKCSDDMVDMFKASLAGSSVIDKVAELSPRLFRSSGGKYSRMSVFDDSPVENIVKVAIDAQECMSKADVYAKKRDMFHKSAEDCRNRMRKILGVPSFGHEKKSEVSDMFTGRRTGAVGDEDADAGVDGEVKMACAIKDLMSKAEITPEEVCSCLDYIEKGAAGPQPLINIPAFEAVDAIAWRMRPGGKEKRIANARRAIILADLMTKDPIISEADPKDVVKAYKTMVMSSPRLSLDPAQVTSFLRNAVNSVAVSPADAKTLTDVEKGMRLANQMSVLDSSIKDSYS